ncbi:hypothetical protein DFH09DRAFT_1298158 [Mycena vulgaris]|nr:hypothetical protein DFH09DRAFT_1298158 [Mycena vulgaris]
MQVKDLPNEVDLGIGMKVMVTSNLETDLDLTNGAKGEIVDIILDPDELPVGNEPMVQLKKMPAYILVMLTRTRASRLPVHFPVTGAYAFTDYRSQGQTLAYVYVDTGTLPAGGLSLFNLYVALSRSSGRDTIRLLRDFDDEIYKKGHEPELLAEDDRLEGLNEDTSQWWARMRRKELEFESAE